MNIFDLADGLSETKIMISYHAIKISTHGKYVRPVWSNEQQAILYPYP